MKLIKLFIVKILILAGMLFVVENTHAQISIQSNNKSIREIIQQIEKESDYNFFFNNDIVDLNKKVSINFSDTPLNLLLDDIFKNTLITYVIRDNKQVVLTVIDTSVREVTPSSGNKIVITGIVPDENNEPIIGANVVEKRVTNGTVTNLNGEFSIQVSPNSRLLVSYIGYSNKEIEVGNKPGLITIHMAENIESLEEIVVIGYGSVKRGNLTTAISAVNAELLQNQPAQSMTDMLQGTIPGLTITSNGGKPGSSATMRLRGSTSLNDEGSPLVLIDGVPGEFNYLNIDDIENITVLKDAASSAIYGSRAAHGVLLVTTKRGKTGKPSFTYNGYAGVNTPTNMPKNINSAEYARIRNEAQANIGREDIYSAEEIRKFADGSDLNRYPNTDWIDLMFRNSFTTRHSLSATGGSEHVKYYVGGGFDHQTGVIDEVQQNIFNVRSNVDIAITKKFNLSFDLRYILRQKDEVDGLSGIIIDIYKMNPTYLAYYTDGSYGYNSNSIINPIAYLHETGHENHDVHDASGIFKLEYELIPGLRFTGIANVNFKYYDTKTIGKTLYFTDYFTKEEITRGQNTLTQKREDNSYYNLQALLNYQKTWNNHSIDLLGGYQQENEKYTWISAYRDGFPTDLVHEMAGGSKDNWTNDGNGTHWAIASFIGRINYDYAGKYLATFNIRADGSSRFIKKNRWSSFPSVAGAWRISAEPFMEFASQYLNDLKIRASWGKTGASSGLGLYPSYTTIATRGIVLNNNYLQTSYLKTLGNTDLEWEKTTMFDIGLDALLLNNRLGFTFDIYNKHTNNILIALPVPMEYGFSNPYVNIGEVKNKGWEIDLKWYDKIGKVNYQIQANLSNNKNKILDLGNTEPWIDGSKYTDIGKPMNSIYGYEAVGLFQSEEEIENSPFQNINNKPGDIKYKDQNNDGKIDGDDRVILGDPNPHYLYGLRLGADYKGFDINLFFQGVGKKDYIMNGPGIQPLTDAGKGPIFEHQLDYWREDNRNAKYPRILDSSQGSFNYSTSDFWKINAGYFRLKNLQVGYNFSKSILKNSGFENIRLFFSATNLFTIDNFIPGYDPETSNAYTYPLARTYSIGMNVKF